MAATLPCDAVAAALNGNGSKKNKGNNQPEVAVAAKEAAAVGGVAAIAMRHYCSSLPCKMEVAAKK